MSEKAEWKGEVFFEAKHSGEPISWVDQVKLYRHFLGVTDDYGNISPSPLAKSWGIDEHAGEMDGDGLVSYPPDKPTP